ncbi:TetR/AcrR family transcriptional regulator C-terminal domain-containing protein [Sinosporangium siamense]|uniref:TetR family transcriptional regulator n=1 Tax=Sinosporangium siamense TaxID=1367973 RepID=A0A919RGB5_9ACTN|nr:TetR/AcrR family transcriptional regulator C-terminal domain-containing protein [Sinosporangium siamense]GII92240.1 TetR family transcriptional regulator [Sinosporangium siamense]
MSAERPAGPALNRDYIIRMALGLVDRVGIEGLSMRELGVELGVDPMAVYYHLPNKAALFDGIVEAVYAEVDVAPGASGDWRELVANFMRRLREVLRRHPRAVPILATRPSYTPKSLADQALGSLQAAGLPPRRSLDIVACLGAYTIGHVLAEVSPPAGGETATAEEAAEPMAPDTFPHLARAVAGGYRGDEQFEAGLRAMLAGFTSD